MHTFAQQAYRRLDPEGNLVISQRIRYHYRTWPLAHQGEDVRAPIVRRQDLFWWMCLLFCVCIDHHFVKFDNFRKTFKHLLFLSTLQLLQRL